MENMRFTIVVLLVLIFSGLCHADEPGRRYRLIRYDVPQTTGTNTSLFDLTRGGQVVIGTYFTNRQNAFGISPKTRTFTLYNMDDSFVNFVIAVSNVALVGSADLPEGKRVGTIWPRKPWAAWWEKTLSPLVPSSSLDRNPIIIDIGSYEGTALLGLNNRGHVVGAVQRADFTFRGFSLIAGKVVFFDYPGAQSTRAEGIRHDGTIVGTYTRDNVNHGFIRTPRGQFKPFDVPQACETFLLDTNDVGDLAGAYVDCASQQMRGYVFTRKRQFLTITFPGAGTTATEVHGLDEQGNIAGRFDDATGRHGFLGILR
jgi:hypothetical protein